MEMLPAPLFAVLLLSGCAVSTINVLEKKDTPKHFTNILAVYVDGDMDFSVFDSTTYISVSGPDTREWINFA